MAALIEGQQYGLSAQGKINSNKTIIFVKLTDSALSSIEKYVKNKGNTDSKATIQFQNSNGVLSLPQNGVNQSYGFSLSNVDTEGPQGSFECLRQIGQRSLESLGCMHMKMHIHANEDSYENTRVKMAAVEKEKNKSCTKEIKVAGTNFARKVKVKRPGFVGPPKPISSPPSSSLINKNPLKITNGITNSIANNIPPKKLQPNEVNKYQKPVPVKSKPPANPELLRQPIRDRIIHILAVRPYRRPELMCRLNSEGVKEKDKKGITAILTQVGVLKKNEYNLANYCWNEVQDNWKFASPEELEIIRRRKQQRLSANTANESAPVNTSSSPNPAQKRVVADSFPIGGQEPRGKKQRISHYNRTGNSNPVIRPESSDSNDKLHLTTTNMTRKPVYSPNMNGIDPEGGLSPKSPSNSCDGFSKKPRLPHYIRTDHFNHNSYKKDTSDSSEKLPFSTSSKVTAYSPVQSSGELPMDLESSPKSPDNSCDGFSNSALKNSASNHCDDALSSSSLRNASREDGENSVRKHTTGLSQQESRNYDRSFPKGQQPMKRHEQNASRHSSSKSSVNSDTSKSSFQTQTLSHSLCDPKAQVSPDSNTQYQAKDGKIDSCSKSIVNGYVNSSIKSNGYSNQSSYVNRSKVTSTTNGSCSTSPHSPESYSDSNDSIGNSPGITHHNLPPTPDSYTEVPDYVTKYVRIRSPEQRSKYKQDFNAQYDDYLLLHSKIEKIKAKFTLLHHTLSNYEKGSEEYRKISSKIEKAYRAYQEDENYKKSEEKLHYLHNKLSHIKKLVMEYDNEYFVRS